MPTLLETSAFLYGRGVFTTVAIRDGQLFLWEKHWSRLAANAAALDIDLSRHPESTTLAALMEAISERAEGRARITFTDASTSRIWSKNAERKTDLSIIVAERRPVPDNFKLAISPHRINTTSPLIGIKSCNYLEPLLAYEEAVKRGFQEAIRLNERGEVATACMANLFWEKGGKLFTPSLDTGCLPGTTREFVLEKLDCEEVEWGPEELGSADRLFLTSAGIGAAAVAEFEGRRLDTSSHRLTELIC
jgi:branched-subunit amino acid aminotransferase/4-amino-4-deoxychorismate lyase